MVIARDEPVEGTAAMTGDNPEFWVPVKDLAVGQTLHGPVLLGHERDLIVLWDHPVARIERVGAVNDDGDVESLAALVEREPVGIVHARGGAAPPRIGTHVRGDEAELVDAAIKLANAVTRIWRVAQLRELAGAEEAMRVEGALLVDQVVDVLAPRWQQVRFHPPEHEVRSWSEDLDVDRPLVYVGHMTGGRGLVVRVRQTETSAKPQGAGNRGVRPQHLG